METQASYLYGAAIQGIQGFIFQTNSLKDIVGASELVECICTTLFAQQLGYSGNTTQLIEALRKDENAIVNAAGTIKYLFSSREECEKVVRSFPKAVIEFAPGITVSQAVVEMQDNCSDEDFKKAVLTLEARLRVQRNRPMRSTQPGWLGIERSRQTGLPVIDRRNKKNEPLMLDAASFRKLYTMKEGEREERKMSTQLLFNKAYKGCRTEQIPFQLKDLTDRNDWIAVIHADGNGLGQVVQHIGANRVKLKKFSYLLDLATTQAANGAFDEVRKMFPAVFCDKVPFRPIVLSGDDHTLICRADLAIPYLVSFIKLFEEKTHSLLGNLLQGVFKDKKVNMLTACAGIAFIKSSFPFYYAYELAENLCSFAKKDTKENYDFNAGNLPASCLAFHKVQDSFIVDYKDIILRELTPNKNYTFQFGPYYVYGGEGLLSDAPAKQKGRWSVEQLLALSDKLEQKEWSAVRSGLRSWITHVYMNADLAEQKKTRMKMIAADEEQKMLIETLCGQTSSPVYDLLSLVTIRTQETQRV